eukprot:1448014-Prymnesium_polylepis.1
MNVLCGLPRHLIRRPAGPHNTVELGPLWEPLRSVRPRPGGEARAHDRLHLVLLAVVPLELVAVL